MSQCRVFYARKKPMRTKAKEESHLIEYVTNMRVL
jgi:hypothetical protein